MADIKNEISHYDCLAWVPTVRGALSLEIVEDAKLILGDVDKYLVAIKSYEGLRSKHHIAATALLTFNDSKYGPDIIRTFRYIFCGQIPPEEESHNVVTGRLCILAEETGELSDNEVYLLNRFKKLTNLKKEYDKSAKIKADNMSELKAKRDKMISIWGIINSLMASIVIDEKNPRINFCFDVKLYRDGLLLLKYDQNSKYKSYIFDDKECDYTQHLPLHRIFKVGMNIIKYLFHTNYHHNADHDTLLPASNLHPLLHSDAGIKRNICCTSIFRHQLDSLLTPITKIKRNGFHEYTINPRGIFQYAYSLINVFGKNGLIDSDEESRSLRFLNAQQQEYEIMTEKHRTKRNAIFSSDNPLSFLKETFSFVSSILLTAYTNPVESSENILYTKYIIVALVLWYFYYMLIRYIFQPLWLPNDFIIEKGSNCFFFANSDLEKKRFSYRYIFWKKIQDWKLTLKISYYYLKTFFIAVILISLILGILYVLDWQEIIYISIFH